MFEEREFAISDCKNLLLVWYPHRMSHHNLVIAPNLYLQCTSQNLVGGVVFGYLVVSVISTSCLGTLPAQTAAALYSRQTRDKQKPQ